MPWVMQDGNATGLEAHERWVEVNRSTFFVWSQKVAHTHVEGGSPPLAKRPPICTCSVSYSKKRLVSGTATNSSSSSSSNSSNSSDAVSQSSASSTSSSDIVAFDSEAHRMAAAPRTTASTSSPSFESDIDYRRRQMRISQAAFHPHRTPTLKSVPSSSSSSHGSDSNKWRTTSSNSTSTRSTIRSCRACSSAASARIRFRISEYVLTGLVVATADKYDDAQECWDSLMVSVEPLLKITRANAQIFEKNPSAVAAAVRECFLTKLLALIHASYTASSPSSTALSSYVTHSVARSCELG
jgi:hypothetical protein